MSEFALVISPGWRKYYASSPYLNLLNSNHPRFKKFEVLPNDFQDRALLDDVFKHKAIVVDDVNTLALKDFPGLKFMIAGDPHAHTRHAAELLEDKYLAVDFVLANYINYKKSFPYFYPRLALELKHLYFPHSVPDEKKFVQIPWNERHMRAVLSGSRDPLVYPYRACCAELSKYNSSIHVLDRGLYEHEHYFAALSGYAFAITCNSKLSYTVAKYFEIPWLGSILVAPAPTQEEQLLLGFKHDVNAVFIEEPRDLLHHLVDYKYDLRGDIAEAGQRLMEKHTAFRRLDYLAEMIDKIAKGGFRVGDEKEVFLNHQRRC